MKLDETLALWGPRLLSLLRIVTALIFMEHGTREAARLPAPD